jgi:hypothetical protein
MVAGAYVIGNDDALLAVVHTKAEQRWSPLDQLEAEKLRAILRPVIDPIRADTNVTK